MPGEGAEKLGKMVITLVAFIFIFGFLLNSVGAVFNNPINAGHVNAASDWDFSLKRIQNTTFWYNSHTPKTTSGYNMSEYVTGWNVGISPDIGSQSSIPTNIAQQFYPDSGATYILNTYYIHSSGIPQGFLEIGQNCLYGFDGMLFYEGYFLNSHYAYFDMTTLADSYSYSEHMGVVHLTTLKSPLFAFFSFNYTTYGDSGAGLVSAWEHKDCRMTIGAGLYDISYSTTNGFASILGLMTFSGKVTGNPTFDAVLGGIIWAAIIYVIIALAARFIP